MYRSGLHSSLTFSADIAPTLPDPSHRRAGRALLGFAALLALLAWSHPARAVECRASPTVLKSATGLKANDDEGGHVRIHISGNEPLQRGEEFEPKTQFESEADFTQAWKNWIAIATKDVKPKDIYARYKKEPYIQDCGTSGSNTDCVDADLLKVTTGVICWATELDPKTKKYTCGKPERIKHASRIGFTYYKNSKGNWILHTAFPSADDACRPPTKNDSNSKNGKKG